MIFLAGLWIEADLCSDSGLDHPLGRQQRGWYAQSNMREAIRLPSSVRIIIKSTEYSTVYFHCCSHHLMSTGRLGMEMIWKEG